MKLSFKKFTFNQMSILKWLPYMTIVLGVLALAYTTWFIYAKVIVSIDNASDLELKNKDVIRLKLNIDLYEQLNEEFVQKETYSNINIDELRNPFEKIFPPSTLPSSKVELPSEDI